MTALLRVCDVHGVPAATNVTTREAVLYLLFEHPEAMRGGHLTGSYLEEIAAVHE